MHADIDPSICPRAFPARAAFLTKLPIKQQSHPRSRGKGGKWTPGKMRNLLHRLAARGNCLFKINSQRAWRSRVRHAVIQKANDGDGSKRSLNTDMSRQRLTSSCQSERCVISLNTSSLSSKEILYHPRRTLFPGRVPSRHFTPSLWTETRRSSRDGSAMLDSSRKVWDPPEMRGGVKQMTERGWGLNPKASKHLVSLTFGLTGRH